MKQKITKEQLAGHMLYLLDKYETHAGAIMLQQYMWYFLNLCTIKDESLLEVIDIKYSDFYIWKYGAVIPSIWELHSLIRGYNIKKEKINDDLFTWAQLASFDKITTLLVKKLNYNHSFHQVLAWIHEELIFYYGINDSKYHLHQSGNTWIEKKNVDINLIKSRFIPKKETKMSLKYDNEKLKEFVQELNMKIQDQKSYIEKLERRTLDLYNENCDLKNK